MKRNLSNLIIILLMASQGLAAKGYDFEEEKVKEFKQSILSNASIELSNQYGEVQVNTWEKDSIKLIATITISTDKPEEIDKLMGFVSVESHGNESNVVFSTRWTNESSIFRRGSMDLKSLLKSDKKLSVDYQVFMPISCRLSITNRFGDIYLPDYKGPLRIDLSHGDLRAREIKDARSITVKYGKVLIKSIESGLLNIDYGSLILDKAGNLTLESKSSTLEVLEVKRLAIDSRNDQLRLEEVESLRGQAVFSHIRVRKINKLLDLNTTYGDVTARSIESAFELVRLNGSSTDYDLEFGEESTYRFDVEVVGNKPFSYPHEAKLTLEEEDKNERRYEGYLGNEKSTSLIKINLRNGYVNLYKP